MLLLPFNRRQHKLCQRIDQFSLRPGDGDHLAASTLSLYCTACGRGLRLLSFRFHDCSCVVKNADVA